jgi:hypothetical protein
MLRFTHDFCLACCFIESATNDIHPKVYSPVSGLWEQVRGSWRGRTGLRVGGLGLGFGRAGEGQLLEGKDRVEGWIFLKYKHYNYDMIYTM